MGEDRWECVPWLCRREDSRMSSSESDVSDDGPAPPSVRAACRASPRAHAAANASSISCGAAGLTDGRAVRVEAGIPPARESLCVSVSDGSAATESPVHDRAGENITDSIALGISYACGDGRCVCTARARKGAPWYLSDNGRILCASLGAVAGRAPSAANLRDSGCNGDPAVPGLPPAVAVAVAAGTVDGRTVALHKTTPRVVTNAIQEALERAGKL